MTLFINQFLMEQRYHATNQEDQLILSFPENQMIFPRNMNILALYFVSRTLFRNHVLIGQRHHATNINQEVQYHFLKTGSVTCDIVYLRNCQRPDRDASFFFGVRIMLGTILGRFSIIYFRRLGLRIKVMVWVMVRARVRVWVRVEVGVGVGVSVVLWSW